MALTFDYFRWNVEAKSYNSRVFSAIIEALATLPSLSTIAFGFYPERFDLPDFPAFQNVRNTSIRIFSNTDFRRSSVDLPELITKTSRILPSFSATEHLLIHHHNSQVMEDTDIIPSLQTVLSRCPLDNALPLISLDLINVPLLINDRTFPHLKLLNALQIGFNTYGPGRACTGSLPIVEPDGTTSLRSLVVDGSFDNSVFTIIPHAGLRHLSVIDMGQTSHATDSDDFTFLRQDLNAIIPGHATTLQSLSVKLYPWSSTRSLAEWTYDETMMALVSECSELRHLSVYIIVGEDHIKNSSTLVRRAFLFVRLPSHHSCVLAG